MKGIPWRVWRKPRKEIADSAWVAFGSIVVCLVGPLIIGWYLQAAFSAHPWVEFLCDKNHRVWTILIVLLITVPFKRFFAELYQYTFGLSIVSVFLQSSSRENMPISRLFATGILLFCLLVAEASEIAFTQLLAKEPDRCPGTVRNLLEQMNRNRHLFFGTREWFVIGIIIGLTFLSDFTALHILKISSPITNHAARIFFSLIFTTVIVAWTVQSPAKESALEAPLFWMRIGLPLWKGVKKAGLMMEGAGLFTPAFHLTRLVEKLIPPSNLRPSQEALFNTLLKRYGYAMYELRDDIYISKDGSARHEQVGLLYIVSGKRTRFTRWFAFCGGVVLSEGSAVPRVNIGSWKVSNFTERISEDLERTLKDIFTCPKSVIENGKATATASEFGLDSEPPVVTPAGLGEDEKVSIVIRSPIELPEGLDAKMAVAIRYEIVVEGKEQSYEASHPGRRDHHYRLFEFPCRRYTSHIHLADDLNNHQFGSLVKDAKISSIRDIPESARIIAIPNTLKKLLTIEVAYPMPGVKYDVSWELWPLTESAAARTASAASIQARVKET